MTNDGDAAERKMDEIRENLAAVEHDTGDTSFTVTLSGRVAEHPDAATSHRLIAAADKALCRAIRAGRDRMFHAGSEED
jgi:PleD family two-component response regulator